MSDKNKKILVLLVILAFILSILVPALVILLE
jgi:uncharacterized membrane protein